MPERAQPANHDNAIRKNWNAFLDTMLKNLPDNIDPNWITAAGGLLGILSAYFLSQEKLTPARIAYIASGLADAADGYIARRLNKNSPFGAYLDSIIDRIVDTAMLIGMETFARKHGWELSSNLAAIARPLALSPSTIRAVAEDNNINVSEQAWGSRLPRSIIIGVCLAIPDERVWNPCLGYIAAASGLTTLDRFKSVSDNPEAMQEVWNIFEGLGENYANGIDPLASETEMISMYSKVKAHLVTGKSVDTGHQDMPFFGRTGSLCTAVRAGYDIITSMNHVLHSQNPNLN